MTSRLMQTIQSSSKNKENELPKQNKENAKSKNKKTLLKQQCKYKRFLVVSGVKPKKPKPIYMPSITIFVQYTHQPQIEWKLPKDDSTAKRKSTKHEFME